MKNKRTAAAKLERKYGRIEVLGEVLAAREQIAVVHIHGQACVGPVAC